MALDFALDHPESVDHLVLVASGASDDATSKENLDGLHFFSSMFKKEGIESAIQFVLNLSFFISPGNSAAQEKIRQIYTDNTDMFESDFPLVRLWRPTNPPASKRLSEIHAPVLVLEAKMIIPATNQ
jgi:pimeloyl-ACP methyl ester carboxylesterase